MASEVVKKDGSKQAFDPEKIRNSLKGAAKRTELPEERQNEVVEQVATAVIQLADAKEEIATSEIRENILSELDRVEPTVSAAWKKHEEEKGAGEEESAGEETGKADEAGEAGKADEAGEAGETPETPEV